MFENLAQSLAEEETKTMTVAELTRAVRKIPDYWDVEIVSEQSAYNDTETVPRFLLHHPDGDRTIAIRPTEAGEYEALDIHECIVPVIKNTTLEKAFAAVHDLLPPREAPQAGGHGQTA